MEEEKCCQCGERATSYHWYSDAVFCDEWDCWADWMNDNTFPISERDN